MKEFFLLYLISLKHNKKTSGEYPMCIYENWTQTVNIKAIYDKFINKIKFKTCYINLDKRGDRNNEMINELNKVGIKNYERFSAICPDRKMIDDCDMININKLWPKEGIPPDIDNEKDFNYIKGTVGCKLSHYNILKKFYENPESRYILVLEDDCILKTNTLDIIENSIQSIQDQNIVFNILYLSATIHHHEYHDYCEKINNVLLKIKNGWGNTTHAMIFDIKTVKNVIDILENSDNEVDDVYKNEVNNRYIVYPMTGYQRESVSDIGLFREEERNIKDNSIVSYGITDEKVKQDYEKLLEEKKKKKNNNNNGWSLWMFKITYKSNFKSKKRKIKKCNDTRR